MMFIIKFVLRINSNDRNKGKKVKVNINKSLKNGAPKTKIIKIKK